MFVMHALTSWSFLTAQPFVCSCQLEFVGGGSCQLMIGLGCVIQNLKYEYRYIARQLAIHKFYLRFYVAS